MLQSSPKRSTALKFSELSLCSVFAQEAGAAGASSMDTSSMIELDMITKEIEDLKR